MFLGYSIIHWFVVLCMYAVRVRACVCGGLHLSKFAHSWNHQFGDSCISICRISQPVCGCYIFLLEFGGSGNVLYELAMNYSSSWVCLATSGASLAHGLELCSYWGTVSFFYLLHNTGKVGGWRRAQVSWRQPGSCPRISVCTCIYFLWASSSLPPPLIISRMFWALIPTSSSICFLIFNNFF